MNNYKLSVSKNGKKYTIVFKAETEKIARQKVHDEGYSILSIETINKKDEIGSTFMFSVKTKTGQIKNGKIVGNDLFKAYVKLRKDLDYDVIQLYSEDDADKLNEDQKNIIIKDLKEEFDLVFSKKTEKVAKIEDISDQPKEKKLDNFYLKKELNDTYKLIDFILSKIENLLSGNTGIEIDAEQKDKLKKIFNSIIKLKKSTNIAKLKLIGEVALIKIGKIELNDIEEKHKETSKKLLKETNALLRKIGSKESFIEKNKDINYIFNNIINNVTNYISLKTKKKDDIDRHSHSYVKNMLFLKRYKEKLKENNIFILKNLLVFIFKKDLKLDTFLRRKVIKQNIILLKAKEKGTSYSYTYLKKGVNRIIKSLVGFVKNIKQYLFVVIFIYTILFLGLLNINYYFNLYESNYEGIFYFIVTFFIYLILYLSRNFFLVVLNFVFLFFIVIFGVVNF